MSAYNASRLTLRRGTARLSSVSRSTPRARFLSSAIVSSCRTQRLPNAPSPLLRPSNFLQVSRSQRRAISDQTRSAIQKAIDSSPVVLFMKGTPSTPQCGFSRASIQILSLQGLDPTKFAAFNVLEDAELRQGIKEFSDWPTIPQLYVDGEFVGGTDILQGMYKSGELETLLEGKGYLVPVPKDDEAKA